MNGPGELLTRHIRGAVGAEIPIAARRALVAERLGLSSEHAVLSSQIVIRALH